MRQGLRALWQDLLTLFYVFEKYSAIFGPALRGRGSLAGHHAAWHQTERRRVRHACHERASFRSMLSLAAVVMLFQLKTKEHQPLVELDTRWVLCRKDRNAAFLRDVIR